MHSEKFLKKLCKTVNESISSNVGDFFYAECTQRALAYSKGTPRVLQGHMGTQDTRSLEHVRDSSTL